MPIINLFPVVRRTAAAAQAVAHSFNSELRIPHSEPLPKICGACAKWDNGYCGMWNRETESNASCHHWSPELREWPQWALELKAQKIEGERGVGDTVKRILGQTGETFKDYYLRVTGRHCGCELRAEGLNREFPY